MEEDHCVDHVEDRYGGEETNDTQKAGPVESEIQSKILVDAILHYKNVHPVLQRAIQLLNQELGGNEKGLQKRTCSIQNFIETGALEEIVRAVTANLHSPAFLFSCFELLTALIDKAPQIMADALARTALVAVLDQMVHCSIYQRESTTVLLGIALMSKILRNRRLIKNDLWTQLISTTVQAMLMSPSNIALQSECLLSLELLFQLQTTATVPANLSDIILDILDQLSRQTIELNISSSTAAVIIIARIIGASSATLHFECSAPILAAVLHHCQLARDPNESQKVYVENLFQQLPQAVVHESLAQLTEFLAVNLSSPESVSKDRLTKLQNALMKVLLSVVWREEAFSFLEKGGVAVFANIFMSGSESNNTAIETAIVQTLYYVSKYWPSETWEKLQVMCTGLNDWVEVMSKRCEGENDNLLNNFLTFMENLFHCEGFAEAFAQSNAMEVYLSILNKHRQLPLCAHLCIKSLIIFRDICPLTLSPAPYCLIVETIAEAMCALDGNRSFQLECIKALTLYTFNQSESETLLSNQHIRDIICIMRSRLMDEPFITEALSLVVSTLTNATNRAVFIDQGLLQVVSKALSTYQWSSTDSVGSHARYIVYDVANELDIFKNLSVLRSYANTSNDQTFVSPEMSMVALEACCSTIEALAYVKNLGPSLVENGAILYIIGLLRHFGQQLSVCNGCSYAQLVKTCFHAASNIMDAPVVAQVMEGTAEDSLHAIKALSIHSQLVACEAHDVVIGCLEEVLQMNDPPPFLIDSGCRLLQVVVSFSTLLSNKAKNRWIAVAILILKRNFSPPISRELLFGTTVIILSQNERIVELANRQHIKMLKLIIGILNESIRNVRSCTLPHTECIGAIRALEELLKASNPLPDTLVTRCLGVVRKLVDVVVLSPSTTAQDYLQLFDKAIALFASREYVKRLIKRLGSYTPHEERLEKAAMIDMVNDFEALSALLYFNRIKRMFNDYHPLFDNLAALVENNNAYAQALGSHALYFLELGCLSSQLLRASGREKVINDALCRFADNTNWHSMRWIAALPDKNSREFMLIVEFVIFRIISGYAILEEVLLLEHLDALSYLLRWKSCREFVLASSHILELQSVLWQLVHVNVALMGTVNNGNDGAVSLLGIVSSLLSFHSNSIFSIHYEEHGSEILVRFCLKALESFFSNKTYDVIYLTSMENVFSSTSIILQHCIQHGAEHAHSIIQHQVTRHAFNNGKIPGCERWCLVVLGAVVKSHGLIYVDTLLQLIPRQANIMISLAGIVAENADVFSHYNFSVCLALGNQSTEWQSNCTILFRKLQQQTCCLVAEQATVVNSCRVKNHVVSAVALLSFKYGQLCLETSRNELDDCVQAITQSVFSFYDLFMSASAFETLDYSAIISLHLKMAQLAVSFTIENGRHISIESANAFRLLLGPICTSDEALAVYLDLAVMTYSSPSNQAVAWLLIDATAQVLSMVVQRLVSGLVRSKCLEKSLLNYFTSLRTVFGTQWESREVDNVTKLLRICSLDRWSRRRLLKAVVTHPGGLRYLFEVARVAPIHDTYVINLLFQHLRDINHETQQISELELSTLLAIIKRNLAGKAGSTFVQKWGRESGSEMLRCALKVLNLVVRHRNCAIQCSELGGISVLYDVMCAPSQYQDTILLALETCCCLAHFGADVTHDNFTFALQQLFVSVDINADSSRSYLVFLVLKFVLSVKASALNLSLIQQCRTQILPLLSQSDKKTAMYTQKLYGARQKLELPNRKPISHATEPNKSSALRVYRHKGKVRNEILSSCRNFVQCSDQLKAMSFICLSTFEKTVAGPNEFACLRKAITQLNSILNDYNMVTDCNYVSALVPALCEMLTLHKITTATECTIMQILDHIAFAKPESLLSNDQLNIPALFAAGSLHHRSSLLFARHLSRFCNSIGAEITASSGDEFGQYFNALAPLLFDLLHFWKLDFEIVDRCVATLPNLIAVMNIDELNHLHCGNTLILLNAAVASHVSNSSTTWNWLKCLLEADKLDKLPMQVAQDTLCSVIGAIRLFISYNYVVGRAVLVLVRMKQEKRKLPYQILIESDGVEILLTCLKLYVRDESIVTSCLTVMVGLCSVADTLPDRAEQLLTAEAVTLFLFVSKNYSDNSLICGMCIDLVYRILVSFEKQPNVEQNIRLPVDVLKKQRELLTHLPKTNIVPLIFDLLDYFSGREDYCLLESLLLLLKRLAKDNSIREIAKNLHGLQELQQVIDRIWKKGPNSVLIELAVDCLVNLVSSDRVIGHGYEEFPMWLVDLAGIIHNRTTHRNGTCIEKLIGILKILTVDITSGRLISPKGSFTLLKLLKHVKSNYSLEQALYGLLCSLCEDIASAHVLIVYGAIPITAKRIICHIDDFETLLDSLSFLNILVVNSGGTYSALLDEFVLQTLDLVIQTYPERPENQIYGIARTMLDKAAPVEYNSARTKAGIAKELKPQFQILNAEKPFYDLLREGAKFRVLWAARPAIVETIQIQLAANANYLFFRRKESSQQTKVERIFVSQLCVCPQRIFVNRESPSSPSMKNLTRSIIHEGFLGDHVLRLRVRDEDLFVKTHSIRERVYWDQALQWLLLHRKTQIPLIHRQSEDL